MKRALILNAINPQIGGVLIRGERGTAKSTTARGLAALLPEIEVVEGCEFGCDPNQPVFYCTNCQERLASGRRRCPPALAASVLSICLSAPPKTGSWARWTSKKRSSEVNGISSRACWHAANRGLLYVDEVNLLDDHVVDLLLDSAAMGVNVVEREGISFQHPANFILVGTMNPEEGDLRPQLLDRFAHAVDIEGIPDARRACGDRTSPPGLRSESRRDFTMPGQMQEHAGLGGNRASPPSPAHGHATATGTSISSPISQPRSTWMVIAPTSSS